MAALMTFLTIPYKHRLCQRDPKLRLHLGDAREPN